MKKLSPDLIPEKDREFLSRFCIPHRMGIDSPCSVDGEWDVATNGFGLLLLRGATFPPAGKNFPGISQIMGLELPHSARIDFARLRNWAMATGPLHGYCECCGTKQERAEFAPAMFGPIAINRRLLGHFLVDAELDTKQIEVRWHTDLEPILFNAGIWRLYLMPMRLTEPINFELEPEKS